MKRRLCICAVFAILITGCGDVVQQSTNDSQQNASEAVTNTDSLMDTDSLASSDESSKDDTDSIVFADKFPEVLAVDAALVTNRDWRFNVTLSSEYDFPERYADAWRVLDDQDNELGIRILGHDHAAEQPFTRSATIEIPDETSTVFVEGRDQANGWSGQRFEFKLPRS